jgi:hypothetical protein
VEQVQKLFTAMPDYRATCEDLIAEGDHLFGLLRALFGSFAAMP